MKISLCMIVKDEEAVLARCLESVRSLVDEIVVLDTGSTDRTAEIAAKYANVVETFAWEDDFAAARNASFGRASGDFLMWMDADDVVTEENAKKFPALRALIEAGADTVICPYQTGEMQYARERVLRNTIHAKWQGHVHECIAPFGKIAHAEFAVTHLPNGQNKGMRNLHIYQKWAEKERLSGRDLFYYGREFYYHRLYTEAIAVLEKMLRGEGWYVNKIEACKTLALCHMECGETEAALRALFASFLYGEPRAAVVCEIGAIFKGQKKFGEAAFWFEQALRCRDHTEEGDFELPACRMITPLLELVVCYYALGDTARAVEYHKKTEAIAPDHPSVVFNRKFFRL